MSLHDYEASQEIEAAAYPFYAIIMAAIRQADTINVAKLKREWPDIWEELKERYNAPGGYLDPEEMKEGTDHEP